MKKNLRSADVRRALAAGDPLTAVEIGVWLRMPVREVNVALAYLIRTIQVRVCSDGRFELTPYGEEML